MKLRHSWKMSAILSLTILLVGKYSWASDMSIRGAVVRIYNNNIQANTKETIKFKNFEFNGSRVKDQLFAACRSSDSENCQLKDGNKLYVNQLSFGNLTSSPFAYIGYNGELLAIKQHDEKAPNRFIELKELLETKYGKPKVVFDSFKDECYNRQNKYYAYWKDEAGTIIEIDTINYSRKSFYTRGECDNFGQVTILSKAYFDEIVKELNEEMQEAERQKKKAVDNL